MKSSSAARVIFFVGAASLGSLMAQTVRVPSPGPQQSDAALAQAKARALQDLDAKKKAVEAAKATLAARRGPVPASPVIQANAEKALAQANLDLAKSQQVVDGLGSVSTSSPGSKCSWLPLLYHCLPASGTDNQARFTAINGFYDMEDSHSVFSQVKSTYNGAAASAGVSADIVNFNFPMGMQIALTTNAQVGSSGSSTPSTSTPSSSTPTSSGGSPTLSATGAAQATQNVLYGGNAVISAIYPIVSVATGDPDKPGSFIMRVYGNARQGFDLQNFKANTSTSTSSPNSHSNAQLEGYFVLNAINAPADKSSPFVGSLFAGASYGYSYTSHGYARDYGFAKVSNAVGQISGGLLINNTATIRVSKAFGPSQTYTDSSTNTVKTVNNFKAWSVGIEYQSKPSGK